jgi:DHA2 family methylenomycin A resistance protein-like MFS transporter
MATRDFSLRVAEAGSEPARGAWRTSRVDGGRIGRCVPGVPTPAASPARSLAWITTATSLGFVVVQLDVTIVNVALPRIGQTLHSEVAGLQWVVDAYTLALAVFMLSAGVAGDLWGARRTFVVGFVVFAASSLACSLAPALWVLNGARAAQGFGAALLLPNSLALLNHAFADDPVRRAKAVGFWTAASAAAIAVGPIVGGILVGWAGWRSIFMVNVPLCALGIWLTRRVLPETPKGAEHRHFDPVGQLWAICALTGLAGALIEARPRGWTDPYVLGGAALALTGGTAFVVGESRSRSPMVPLRFFRLPTFTGSVAFGILVNLSYYGTIFVLSLYLQQVRHYSVMATGLAFLPLTAGFLGSNLLSGWMAGRFGSRLPMTLGALIGCLGYLLLHRLGPDSSFASMLAPFLIIPAGMGLGVPAMTTAVLASVERSYSGTASAILNTARQAGGAVGVALFGALSSGRPGRLVEGLDLSAAICAGLLAAAAGAAQFVRPAAISRRSNT